MRRDENEENLEKEEKALKSAGGRSLRATIALPVLEVVHFRNSESSVQGATALALNA